MLPCIRCGKETVGAYGVCEVCGPGEETVGRTRDTPLPQRVDIAGLGKSLQTALWADVVVLLLLAVAEFHRHFTVNTLIRRQNEEGAVPTDLSDTLTGAATLLMTVTGAVTAVLTVVWLYRARTNAETFGRYEFGFGRMWSVGGWLVPVGSLALPLMVAVETRKGTVAEDKPGRAALRPAGGRVVYVWWAAWVLGNLAVGVVLKGASAKAANDFDGMNQLHALQSKTFGLLPGLALLMVAAGALAVFVRQVTATQTRRLAEPFGNGPGTAGPEAIDPDEVEATEAELNRTD